MSIRNMNESPSEIAITVVTNANGGTRQRYGITPGTTLQQIAAGLSLQTSDHVARVNGQNQAWDFSPPAEATVSFAPLKTPGAF